MECRTVGAYSTVYPGFFVATKILPGEQGFRCPKTKLLFVKAKTHGMKRVPRCYNIKALAARSYGSLEVLKTCDRVEAMAAKRRVTHTTYKGGQ